MITGDPKKEEQLALMLADLTDQLHHGKPPNLDEVAQKYPELASELRQRWGTILFLEAMGPALTASLKIHGPSAIPSQAAPLPADLADFEVLEKIGEGGMGVVYRARQRSLNRTVALKTMRKGDPSSAEDRARFKAEAQAAARLDHPHIVPVYAVDEVSGQMYFSMKYIEGSTLARKLASGPLPPREAARLVAVIAEAVHFAHTKGILHRDLKPSNLLLDEQGQPHITDFGLSKRVVSTDLSSVSLNRADQLTASNAILGTPSYMPPEQVDGRRGKPSPASDVYSLGAILYELLTGRPPFLAASSMDVLLQVLDQDPVEIRRLNPHVDRELELICLKCLQKPAELRYASAKKLAEDLNKFLQGEHASVWSGSLKNLASSLFRETHHAPILENWGTLWMWHSLQIFLLCALTNALKLWGFESPWPYLGLWGVGLVVWGAIFWNLRKRGGPVQFIERQIAHLWAGAIVATIGVFVVEILLGLKALTLSPILAVIAGMVFVVKAGMLSGSFYFSAAALFLVAIPMAIFPEVGPLLFGFVTAVCFFVPGYKYSRQRKEGLRRSE